MIILLLIIVFLTGWFLGSNETYNDYKKEMSYMRQKVDRFCTKYEDDIINRVLNFSNPMIFDNEQYIKIKDVAGIIKGK